MLRSRYVSIKKSVFCLFVETPRRLTHSILNPARFKNATTNTEIRSNTWDWTQTLLQFHTRLSIPIYTIKTVYRQLQKGRKKNAENNAVWGNQGNPLWKTGADRPSRPLRLDVPQDHWCSNAESNLGSSVADLFLSVSGGLQFSNLLGNSTGQWVTFFCFAFPEEARKLLGPGKLAEGALRGTYSTRPSSITIEIRTPDQDGESSDNDLTPPAA